MRARVNEPSQIRCVNTFLVKGNEEINVTLHLHRRFVQDEETHHEIN